MRNYIEMFFALYHAVLGVNDTYGEIWARDRVELQTLIEQQRQQWEGAGWTFTVQIIQRAYWLLNKEHFCKIIQQFAQVNNLRSFGDPPDPVVQWEDSPRDTWSHNE